MNRHIGKIFYFKDHIKETLGIRTDNIEAVKIIGVSYDGHFKCKVYKKNDRYLSVLYNPCGESAKYNSKYKPSDYCGGLIPLNPEDVFNVGRKTIDFEVDYVELKTTPDKELIKLGNIPGNMEKIIEEENENVFIYL